MSVNRDITYPRSNTGNTILDSHPYTGHHAGVFSSLGYGYGVLRADRQVGEGGRNKNPDFEAFTLVGVGESPVSNGARPLYQYQPHEEIDRTKTWTSNETLSQKVSAMTQNIINRAATTTSNIHEVQHVDLSSTQAKSLVTEKFGQSSQTADPKGFYRQGGGGQMGMAG